MTSPPSAPLGPLPQAASPTDAVRSASDQPPAAPRERKSVEGLWPARALASPREEEQAGIRGEKERRSLEAADACSSRASEEVRDERVAPSAWGGGPLLSAGIPSVDVHRPLETSVKHLARHGDAREALPARPPMSAWTVARSSWPSLSLQSSTRPLTRPNTSSALALAPSVRRPRSKTHHGAHPANNRPSSTADRRTTRWRHSAGRAVALAAQATKGRLLWRVSSTRARAGAAGGGRGRGARRASREGRNDEGERAAGREDGL